MIVHGSVVDGLAATRQHELQWFGVANWFGSKYLEAIRRHMGHALQRGRKHSSNSGIGHKCAGIHLRRQASEQPHSKAARGAGQTCLVYSRDLLRADCSFITLLRMADRAVVGLRASW